MRYWFLYFALLFFIPPAMAQVTTSTPEALESQCAAGAGDACYSYGMLYEAGKQVPQDRLKAARYYAVACDKASAHGCFELSILYANGTGVPQSWEMAHKYSERACDGGLALACYEAGYDYAAGGRGVTKDKLAAQAFYQRAADGYSRECDKHDADSCRHLSLLLRSGNPDQSRNYALRATALWRAACEGGDGQACMEMGNIYEHGFSIAENLDQAAAFYRKACQVGNAGGCTGFGQLGLQGHAAGAVASEVAKALDGRCNSGDTYRCQLLGQAYASGKLGAPDTAKAMVYFAKGCDPALDDSWHTFGCVDLALGYLHGRGVAQDKLRAIKMLTKLCDGQGGACFVLGKIYYRGDVVVQDLGKARDRFEDGCDANDNTSCYAEAAMAYEGKGGEVDKDKAITLVAKSCQGRRAPEKLCAAPTPSTTFLDQGE